MWWHFDSSSFFVFTHLRYLQYFSRFNRKSTKNHEFRDFRQFSVGLTAKNGNFSKKIFFPVSYAQMTCKEHRTRKKVFLGLYSQLLMGYNILIIEKVEVNTGVLMSRYWDTLLTLGEPSDKNWSDWLRQTNRTFSLEKRNQLQYVHWCQRK